VAFHYLRMAYKGLKYISGPVVIGQRVMVLN